MLNEIVQLKISFLICLQFVFVIPLFAEVNPEYMTSIEYAFRVNAASKESFFAKPRKLLRAGKKYLRMQEVPDYENGIHGLIVVSQPDSWMINLFTKSAKHIVDPGPSTDVHVPIFKNVNSSLIKELEFGNELEFFQKNSAKKTETADKFEYLLEVDSNKLILTTNKNSNLPKLVELTSSSGATSIEYLSYDNKLKFDPTIFTLLPGIALEPLQAQAKAKTDIKNMWAADFMTHYYKHPNPSKIADSLKAIQEDGMLKSFYALIGFFSPIMVSNPELLESWIKTANGLSSDMKLFIFYNLRQCGTPACFEAARENPFNYDTAGIDTFLNTKQPTVEDIPLNSPTSLDFLWSNFLATGSEVPVKRLVKLVGDNWGEFQKKNLHGTELLLVGAAHWSLVSNAEQHPKVYAVLKKESEYSEVLKGVLEEVKITEKKPE